MHANRHTRGQRWLAWVMAVVLCLGLLPGAALAAAALAWAGEGFHGKALPLQDFDGLLEQE